MASGGSKKTIKGNIQSINTHLTQLSKAIQELSDHLNKMMKGDAESEGAYWNGNKATNFYNKAMKNLKGNIEDYSAAYKKLNRYAIAYEKSAQGDR